jgi:S-adenosylmethionine decarboxylase proenzyme
MDHFLIEIFNLNSRLLRTHASLQSCLNRLIELLKLKVLAQISHDFSPSGVTALYVLSSSHLAVHTWPKLGYLHMDLFSCAEMQNKSKCQNSLFHIFNTNKLQIKKWAYSEK